jgi:hypothetical protein
VVPASAKAQEGPQAISAGGMPGQEDFVPPPRGSRFDLRAFGDEGSAGVRANGTNAWCFENITGFQQYFQFGCTTWLVRRATGTYTQVTFDMGMRWGAPPHDLPSTIDPVADGLKGSGWTANITSLLIQGTVRGGGDKIWASDRTSIELLAIGVQSTEDGNCTDYSKTQDGSLDAGFQLLPASDCPATHPPSGWQGAHPIEAEAYLAMQESDPTFGPVAPEGSGINYRPATHDPFAFWRVPEELQRTDKFFGDYQTYGELSDFYLEALASYGTVVPGGSVPPIYDGWPLGLTQKFDAFYFGLPTVGNALFFQSTIVNESEKVYGVGMTYDSVYIGINIDLLLQAQAAAVYFDPDRSAYLVKETGDRCAGQPVPPGSSCGTGSFNWANGAPGVGVVVLKSPIGDMRYELFSDPNSDFFSPGHPRAGDTITFQHQRTCGFGGCIPRTWSRSQRAHFGLFTSTGENVLDGEQPGDLADRTYHRIFRPELWPERTGQFNKYVPGVDDGSPVWDWNHDGAPDTVYADSCGSRGCVTLWADTLPSGYVNNYANISEFAMGPVHMEPYDTVAWVVALVGAADSASFEASVDNTIDFYKNFYLGPEAAPAPTISAVDVVGGQAPAGENEPGAEVTLFWDDSTEQWNDPFLLTVDVSADIELNPWLEDSIDARIPNNVAALHLFKSCDGGTSYTSDGDCDGDPVNDPTSQWSGFGWQPYASFDAEDDGSLPNTFTDGNIVSGISYTFSIVTETRGAEYNVVRSTPGGFQAETVTFAPTLLSGLSASRTNPYVAVAYVPVNLASGASGATLDETSRTGRGTVPVDYLIIGTSPVSGDYQTVFVDSIHVEQVDTKDEAGKVLSTQSKVTGLTLRSVTDEAGETARVGIKTFEFQRTGTVTLSGLEQTGLDDQPGQTVTTWDGAFGFVLASGATPFLASTTLTGEAATPGAFFGREDFPFFTVSVNADDGGTFGSETFVGAAGDTIAARVAPSVVFRRGAGLSEHVDGEDFGTFEITWSDDSFGPGSPFQIGPNLISSYETSISSRLSAGSSSTSAEALEAIKAADPDVALEPGDLVAYDLPFSVANAAYDGRNVEVVVTDHQETILLGQANDSIRVDVPAGMWVPGDETFLVETLTVEQTDENGNTILGSDGQPLTESKVVATFRMVQGCLAPRNSCDPTIGGGLESGYIPTLSGVTQIVEYLVPLAGSDQVDIRVNRAITAQEGQQQGEGGVDDVHVVPNPYLFASAYERTQADRFIKFTSLPPEGRIRIFDVAGRFIQELNYTEDQLQGGDLGWNLQTRENLVLAAGLYLFVLETPSGERKSGKFVVIR